MFSAVELREIRVFLTLADELHFGRTGERLGINHSRVSQTINTLETRLGGRLFDRNTRRVRLTPLGEDFRRGIAPAYDELLKACADTHQQAVGNAGKLRLGVYAAGATGPHLLQIVKAFEATYPKCRVQITETGLARDQADWLRRHDVDLLAIRQPVTDPDLTIGPVLASEERVLVLAVDHALATQESVSVEDLADYTTTDLAAAPREVMDAFSPPFTPSGRPIHRAYIHTIPEAGIRAATGELVHPTVKSYLTHYPHPGLVAIPIRDLPPSKVALMWLKANPKPIVEAFVQTAQEILDAHDRRAAGAIASATGSRRAATLPFCPTSSWPNSSHLARRRS